VTPLLDAAATARLARLVTDDMLTEHHRELLLRALYRRRDARAQLPIGYATWAQWARDDPEPPALAQLLTCPWCASFWLGLGVVAARRLAPGLWGPLAKALAYSQAAGMAARITAE
jgi:hypothetical protein